MTDSKKPRDEQIENFALQYTKKNPYSHVKVEESWYKLTNEYKAFLEGAKCADANQPEHNCLNAITLKKEELLRMYTEDESELTKLRAQLEVGTKCLINMVSNETIVQAVLESRLALAKIEALNK